MYFNKLFLAAYINAWNGLNKFFCICVFNYVNSQIKQIFLMNYNLQFCYKNIVNYKTNKLVNDNQALQIFHYCEILF